MNSENMHDRPRAATGEGFVDVHAHYLTPTYRAAAEGAGHARPDGMPALAGWSARVALDAMDMLGIGTMMLSISSPGVHFGDHDRARGLARQVNEEGAGIVRARPLRFGLLASLPLPDIDGALTELDYAFDVLGVDGITLLTHYGGRYLGDPAFEPVMAELDRRAAVVTVHPTSPACWQATSLGYPRPMMEFLFDTTRTIINLVLTGVLDRYPGIRWVIPHSGAALPAVADRVALSSRFLLERDTPASDVLAALRRLHYDVAGMALPRALPSLLTLVEPEQLLYGSDYPFTPSPAVASLADGLTNSDVLSPEQRDGMFRANALRLFPRLDRPASSTDKRTPAP